MDASVDVSLVLLSFKNSNSASTDLLTFSLKFEKDSNDQSRISVVFSVTLPQVF